MTSSSAGNGSHDEISELADAVISGRASDLQRQRLDQLVRESDDACWAYVCHMHDTITIHRRADETRLASSLTRSHQKPSQDELPLLSKIADQSNEWGPPSNDREPQDGRSVRETYQNEGIHFVARAVRDHSLRGLVALTTCLCVAVAVGLTGWYVGTRSTSHPSRPASEATHRVAKVVRSVNPVWTRNGHCTSVTTGDWLLTGRYTLTSGLVQIVFPWGTKVTLEAPADIEFTPDGGRRLWHGQLVAKVSPQDTGFTIDTPSVKLVDLGTEFGLSTESNGSSEIHVFKGAVEARPVFASLAQNKDFLTMLMGDANSFTTKETPVQQIAFNPKRFSKAWRLNSRVTETTGSVRFVHPAPLDVTEGHAESNEELTCFLERESTRLTEAIAVTITEPGLYTNFTDRITWIPAETEVDSYLIHFDPIGSKNNQPAVTAQGTITFDRPILAVIARGDQLATSDQWLACPSTTYQAQGALRMNHDARYDLSNILPAYAIRGLTGLWNTPYSHESPAPNDWIRLSVDHRTLTIKCTAGGEANQLRLLVATNDQPDPLLFERSPPQTSQPYHGRPFFVGQTIEAEDFDLGGQDVAYYDTSPDSLANVYRLGESVELRSYLIGQNMDTNVSIARAGEWLAYTVDIEKPGQYVVKTSAGSMLMGGLFRIEFGEATDTQPIVTPTLSVPLTRLEVGDRSEWYGIVESTPVELKPGRQVMRVIMEKNHSSGRLGNFDWFRIEAVDSEPTPPLITE